MSQFTNNFACVKPANAKNAYFDANTFRFVGLVFILSISKNDVNQLCKTNPE